MSNKCLCGEYGILKGYSGKTAWFGCPRCGDEWTWVNPDSLEKIQSSIAKARKE